MFSHQDTSSLKLREVKVGKENGLSVKKKKKSTVFRFNFVGLEMAQHEGNSALL